MTRQAHEMDTFTEAYIECAFWATIEEGVRDDVGELAPSALETMRADCADFQTTNAELLETAYADANGYGYAGAGHDFWLTRNRHGAGFWDRGLGDVGRQLTDMAHAYGEADLYRGDDGLIYHS